MSQLAVELSEFVLVDGRQVPLRTELVQSSAGTSRGRDAVGVGTTTGIGAVIGTAIGGGEGAAIGAAALRSGPLRPSLSCLYREPFCLFW